MRSSSLDRGRDSRWATLLRRAGMLIVIPGVIATTSACGSSGDESQVVPGETPDASSDATLDAKTDAKTDAPLGDAGDGGPVGCVPKTCATLEANCGSAPDGCGGKIECGDCPDGQLCGGGGANKCGADECNPKSCVQVGASCGYASDGCSQAIDCGGCSPPTTCGGGGTPNQCGCAPKTCAQLDANCGTVPDGCLGVVDCGNCLSGQTCGGGGPNQCGAETCTPKTCAQLSASCGYVSDGCSKALNCGECTEPNVCGGGGTANQCGCTPKSCSQLGASCGTVDNGCQTVNCGECTLPDTCGGGGVDSQCGCLCTLPHATTSCLHGECSIKQCEAGWGDCDGLATNGCEVDLRNTVTDCGACGVGCSFQNATAVCQLSKCELGACNQNYDNCDGDDSNGCEANLKSDPSNCNACGTQCPALGGTPTCSDGTCGVSTCDTGKGDCDPNVPGCETDTTTSVEHCAFCNNPCTFANATASCVASTCELDACSAGYGNCDSNESNGCEVNTDTSVANCGACDNACPTPPHSTAVCTGGQCGYTCNAGWADCDGQAGNGCEISTNTDLDNCGACSKSCSVAHGTPSCSAGSCVVAACDSGWGDCNALATDGCEVDTTTSAANCGACGQACSTNHGTASCTNSQCGITCDSGFLDCDGQAYNGCEVNITTDTQNCGGCGVACSSNHMATVTCDGGMCTGVCANFYGDCDSNRQTNGCEADLRTDVSNCSGCGVACSANNMDSISCSNGVCNGACKAGFDDCNGNKQSDGCEINLLADPTHCGSCINVCSSTNMATVTCGGGVCNGTCTAGWSDCDGNKLGNGCEVNTDSDVNHCGSCTLSCSTNNISVRECTAGTCTGACNPSYADCDSDKSVNGCEINLTNDPSHCGNCWTDCNSPVRPNVTGTQCLSSTCQVTSCQSGYYNQDNQWATGCECGVDTIANLCGAASSLGSVNQGITNYYPSSTTSYNLTPTGDEDWFIVSFANAATCTYKPRIELVDLSGVTPGVLRMQLFASTTCAPATQMTCNGTSETGTASTASNMLVWEFNNPVSNCGDHLAADPVPDLGYFFNFTTNTVAIRVYATGASTTCLPYRLKISNSGP